MPEQFAAQAAVEAARAFLAGEICLIECSVRLTSLAHSLVPDWKEDPDFLFFGVLASDTDHLPYGSARQYWNATALAAADVEIGRIEGCSRDEALQACKHIVERFKSD
jgi:hypothetical protein